MPSVLTEATSPYYLVGILEIIFWEIADSNPVGLFAADLYFYIDYGLYFMQVTG